MRVRLYALRTTNKTGAPAFSSVLRTQAGLPASATRRIHLAAQAPREDVVLGIGCVEGLGASQTAPFRVAHAAWQESYNWRIPMLTRRHLLAGALPLAFLTSLQFFLTPTPNVTYSAFLAHGIEEMFASGVAPYPVERTLIVSEALEACLKSRQQGAPLDTPYLDVKYQAPEGAHHCRA